MVDVTKKHYFDYLGAKSVKEIAELIGAEISLAQALSASEKIVYDIKNIEESKEGDLTFINNKKYASFLSSAKCSACLVEQNFAVEDVPADIILLRVDNPYYAYSKALKILYAEKQLSLVQAISPVAKIGKDVSLGFNVIIEDGAVIGDNCIIDHNVVIKHDVKIGSNCKIGAGAYVSYAQIGANTLIHPGVKIGTDGFGFSTYKGVHHKIFHIGSVIIGENVEIGANSTIDRGSTKDTIIGSGTIIDNLVQIAHNVEIGKGCIIVAQVGIAGSTKLGNYVVVGGQAGLAGHLKVANFVQIAGKSGVISDIETEKKVVGGYPSQPIIDWHRQTILLRKMLHGSK